MQALDWGGIMTPPDEQPERRRVQRIGLCLEASAREPGRSRVPVRVIDISTHGCRIELFNGSLADDALWLGLANLQPQLCRIAWHREGFAGLEFGTPISEAVLDTLLAPHRKASETTVGELKELAKRAHRLSAQSPGEPGGDVLREFARDCSLQAVVQGLKLSEEMATPGEASGAEDGLASLTGSMIRRNTREAAPGFSFEQRGA